MGTENVAHIFFQKHTLVVDKVHSQVTHCGSHTKTVKKLSRHTLNSDNVLETCQCARETRYSFLLRPHAILQPLISNYSSPVTCIL